MALIALSNGHPDKFLALPLAVVLPCAAFFFLARLNGTRSSEGALMRLAAMVLLLLIVMLPSFSLLLALGFPVAFLVVELFDTHMPPRLRDPIKTWVIR